MQFFLIHGGWQGGWCWDGVVAELERRGHTAVAPTLAGLEPEARDRSGVGWSTLVASAVAEIEARAMSDAVVVGHSGGGSIAQGIAERVAERIRLIIFMSARVLRHGEALLDLGEAARRRWYEHVAATTSDNAVPLPEEVWTNRLCRDMTEQHARSWLPRVVPNPLRWLREPANLPSDAWRKIPSAYLFLDGESPSAKAFYERMAARLPEPRTAHCPGAHEAMLSQPLAVAEAIVQLAVEVSR